MPKKRKDPLTRAIEHKERMIRKYRDKINAHKADYLDEAARIEKKIQRETVLLEALKRGALQP